MMPFRKLYIIQHAANFASLSVSKVDSLDAQFGKWDACVKLSMDGFLTAETTDQQVRATASWLKQ